jgi:23S rRNA (cytidine1920-2'-O)/16S rRNA (cytidine1409-2'-O)-methyltransferase
MAKKKRFDQILHEKHPQYSRTQIQSWIMRGKARIAGNVETKAGIAVADDAIVDLEVNEPKFVSRGGIKIEHALEHFGIDVTGLVALDAGISTGGFTDCLLQHGAKKVYGVDVGYGQVHDKIRRDERVILIERTNVRNLTDVGEKIDLISLDLAFISILKVMDAVCSLLKENGQLVTLIKPQFEARREDVGKGGIVRDPRVHQEVIKRITTGIEEFGVSCVGVTTSPIEGADGNKEFLAYFKRMPKAV